MSKVAAWTILLVVLLVPAIGLGQSKHLLPPPDGRRGLVSVRFEPIGGDLVRILVSGGNRWCQRVSVTVEVNTPRGFSQLLVPAAVEAWPDENEWRTYINTTPQMMKQLRVNVRFVDSAPGGPPVVHTYHLWPAQWLPGAGERR